MARTSPLVSMVELEALIGFDRVHLQDIAKSTSRFYRPVDVRPIGTNKKWRHLDRSLGELKQIQSRIQSAILSKFPFPERMFGSVPGYSIRDNAEIHIKKRFVLTVDIRDCFPNTTNNAVFGAWVREFGCSTEIAGLLTQLTTFHRRLPQGAPTSPLLANLTLIPMYRAVENLAFDLGCDFSFFVDDIAISGKNAPRAKGPLIEIIHQYGHAVSHKKIHLMDRRIPQHLPGAVVNRGVSNGEVRLQFIREELQRISSLYHVTEHDLRRAWGLVYQAEYVCPDEGKTLVSLANDLLGDMAGAADDVKSEKYDRRRCKSFARHRMESHGARAECSAIRSASHRADQTSLTQ